MARSSGGRVLADPAATRAVTAMPVTTIRLIALLDRAGAWTFKKTAIQSPRRHGRTCLGRRRADPRRDSRRDIRDLARGAGARRVRALLHGAAEDAVWPGAPAAGGARRRQGGCRQRE